MQEHAQQIGPTMSVEPPRRPNRVISHVITSFDGVDIDNPDELLQRLVLHKPGDQVSLSVARAGQTVNLTLTLGEAPVQ